MATYRNETRHDQWRGDQAWRPGDNDRDRDRERYGERDGEGGRFGYGGASSRGQQDDDRMMRWGSMDRGREREMGDEDLADRGRGGYGYREHTGYRSDMEMDRMDRDRDRYSGRGGQSGSQSGEMSMSGRARLGQGSPYETTGYGYGGGYAGGSMQWQGDREGYRYGERGGRGYGEEGGGYGGGTAGGRAYGGGVSRGRERDLGWYRDQDLGTYRAHPRDLEMRSETSRIGGHRGKGPAGYQRSDERVLEDISQVFTDEDELDATGIEIRVTNGEVTLAGHVTDRRQKRLAEDLAERIPGVKDVSNAIRVQAESGTTTGRGNGRTGKPESVSSSPEKDTEAGKRPRA